MEFRPLGDSALIAHGFGDTRWRDAASFAVALRNTMPTGVIEVISAFDSVAIHYDPLRCESADQFVIDVRSWAADAFEHDVPTVSKTDRRQIQIPVRYGRTAGPDLAEIADAIGAPVDDVIRLHSSAEYRVLAIGFMPGFGYLGGLPDVLKVPRRVEPRTRVEEGSVGIGGPYTGVYPFNSPGGWHLIGHTELKLFDPTTPEGSLLRVGDIVRFVPVDENNR